MRAVEGNVPGRPRRGGTASDKIRSMIGEPSIDVRSEFVHLLGRDVFYHLLDFRVSWVIAEASIGSRPDLKNGCVDWCHYRTPRKKGVPNILTVSGLIFQPGEIVNGKKDPRCARTPTGCLLFGALARRCHISQPLWTGSFQA